MPVDAFVEFLDEIVDEETKNNVRQTLIKDKQLPDKSFKAIATGVLSKLGEKVAGEAGKAIAGELVGEVARLVTKKVVAFVTSLVAGDAKGAAKSISKDDFDRCLTIREAKGLPSETNANHTARIWIRPVRLSLWHRDACTVSRTRRFWTNRSSLYHWS
ncbi:hypothetical protein [Bradyrhizobium sp. ARR65]|uniref:hypothetical protein n=1 Tax=Bradyrhizobium sp. ARR65 TaxID=1040989 RepID=UPI000A92F0C9|nr:hypothetical protein [Bradyrhizobium sp. ARR65]